MRTSFPASLRMTGARVLVAGGLCGAMLVLGLAQSAHATQVNAHAKRVLKIATDPTYPPYEYKQGSTYAGFEIDTAKLIAQQMNADIKWVPIKYTAVTATLASGRADMSFTGGIPDNPDRRRGATLVRYFFSNEGFMVKKGNPTGISSIKGLCGHSVSVYDGNTWSKELRAAAKKCPSSKPMKIVALTEGNGPITAVKTGRAEAYFGDLLAVSDSARKLGSDYTSVRAADGAHYGASFAIKKGNYTFANEVGRALQELINAGKMEKVARKWGLPAGIIVKRVLVDGKLVSG